MLISKRKYFTLFNKSLLKIVDISYDSISYSLNFMLFHLSMLGSALMAVWSNVLPPTASCLLPLPWFESQPGYVSELAVTWGQAVVITGYSGDLDNKTLKNPTYFNFFF